MNIEFLYKDDYFFAIKKPPNIHSVINEKTKNESVASILKNSFPKLEDVSLNKEDCGLLNRLDFQTSGILYGAWNKESWDYFHKNSNIFNKTYIAICEGKVESQTITSLLGGKYRGSKKVTALPLNKEQKRFIKAETKIELVSYNKEKNISLVKAHIQNAKRHQIRAHLGFVGNPLLGDKLYGSRKEFSLLFPNNQELEFLLHNETLSFFHPFLKKDIFIEYKLSFDF